MTQRRGRELTKEGAAKKKGGDGLCSVSRKKGAVLFEILHFPLFVVGQIGFEDFSLSCSRGRSTLGSATYAVEFHWCVFLCTLVPSSCSRVSLSLFFFQNSSDVGDREFAAFLESITRRIDGENLRFPPNLIRLRTQPRLSPTRFTKWNNLDLV
ncbi:hypothetical protein Sjap_018332 [Stephania japonica]|uniref:Uncharacterized protein n=1 Tax=Stephania japonica TaxID=461633 RepID=A0AAP0NJ90_9MAGN